MLRLALFTARMNTVKAENFHVGFRHSRTFHRRPAREHTAGIIIIGDEIIKGQVQDTNSQFLTKRLHSFGVHVEKISVIRDDIQTIADEVQSFSKSFTYVLTSGGIGPTHDDITYEGVAKAFGEPVKINATLAELVNKLFANTESHPSAIRLAQVPASAKLNFLVNKTKGVKNRFPLVSVQNVYIFPGIPTLLERIFDHLGEELFFNPDYKPINREIYIAETELAVTSILNSAVERFGSGVVFGSYPELCNSYYKVKFTMEAENEDFIREAENYIKENIPNGSVVDYEKDPVAKVVDKVYSIVNSTSEEIPFANSVQKSVKILEECFDRHSPSEVCLSFNGGKDCTVLLHLVFAVIGKLFPTIKERLLTIYIRDNSPFPQLEQFLQESAVRYNFKLITLSGSIKDALVQFKLEHPTINATIMGTRRTDPYSDHLKAFQDTDPDWPRLVRVHPILDWSYQDVWAFIRHLSLPYCILYDRGYTSLGSMQNTFPNPVLQYVDGRGAIQYSPAYMLKDGKQERQGRKDGVIK